MGTITYGDKVAINENTSVADINKVNASDMNEIKTAVNDNDSNITGLQGTILWTNSSPTSNMTTRNITLSSDDYDVLEIIYKAAYNQKTIKNIKMLKDYNTIMTAYSINFTTTSYYMRAISYVDATTLTIGSGYYLNPTSKTQNDGVCIPLYVIGYKTGVF